MDLNSTLLKVDLALLSIILEIMGVLINMVFQNASRSNKNRKAASCSGGGNQ